MSYAVKDYMSKDVPTVGDRFSATEAAKKIKEVSEGFLIVLKEGQPVGIITEEDFVEKIVAAEKDPAKTKVSEIMSSPLITIGPDEDLLKASALMQEHNIRRIPVVKNGIIYGVITVKEIAQRCGDDGCRQCTTSGNSQFCYA